MPRAPNKPPPIIPSVVMKGTRDRINLRLAAGAWLMAIRPKAAETIKHLKQLGIEQVVMLTGDNERTANSVAQQLGIDQVYASLLPEDKVTAIRFYF